MVIKLIGRILVFVGLLFVFSYSALYINPDFKKEYVAGIIPKLEKLKSVKVKKIVIIGGSNACFGIDTYLMETQLGMPVVNMSLHGGLPLKYIIEQVKYHLNKGDILILAKEYEGLKDQYWNKMNGIELPKVATYDMSQFYVLFSDRILLESTVIGILKTIQNYIVKFPIKGRNEIVSVYDARVFQGDNLKSEFLNGEYKVKIDEHPLHKAYRNSLVSVELKKYKEYFKQKGIEFYLTPPVIIEGFYKDEEILPFWNQLSLSSGVPLLSKDKRYTYAREYFLNSHYHTNKKGREIRTKSLIEDIQKKHLKLANRNVRHNILVTPNEMFKENNLDLLNDILNFKVLKKDRNGLLIKQHGSLDHNYFRMRFEGKNYKGYNFYLLLECSPTVIENIKFRGFGILEEFDTIIPLGDQQYKLWKKVNNVQYIDNNSYLGISFPENNNLIDKSFLIKEVGVYNDFGEFDYLTDSYVLSSLEGKSLYFKVISDSLKSDLIDINERGDKIEIITNRLYTIDKMDNKIQIVDFYSGNKIFETADKISIYGASKSIIEITE